MFFGQTSFLSILHLLMFCTVGEGNNMPCLGLGLVIPAMFAFELVSHLKTLIFLPSPVYSFQISSAMIKVCVHLH